MLHVILVTAADTCEFKRFLHHDHISGIYLYNDRNWSFTQEAVMINEKDSRSHTRWLASLLRGAVAVWSACFDLSSAEGIPKQFHRFIFVLKGKWKETMSGQQDEAWGWQNEVAATVPVYRVVTWPCRTTAATTIMLTLKFGLDLECEHAEKWTKAWLEYTTDSLLYFNIPIDSSFS